MSSFTLIDCSCFVHGYDFTTDLNSMNIKIDVDDQENTTFQSGGYKSRVGGLRGVESELQGFWQAGDAAVTGTPDTVAFPDLGVANRVVTITPTETAGDVAYIYQAGSFSYEMFGDIGDLTPFTLSMMNTHADGLVRGRLVGPRGDVSATGQLGSVIAMTPVSGQYLYAVLHVFSAGTTITVQVQSDDSSGFSDPTTRGTIGPITTTGGTWMTRLDASSWTGETHWRMNVSAITGTFNVAGVIGLQ